MTVTSRKRLERPPRRLPRDARREQLVAVAMPIVGAEGLAEFSLDAIAERAGVTRNLLYHYFPRGRPDIVLAVAEQAGRELTDGWITDESIPLAERVNRNNAHVVAHALGPSDAWRVYRLVRTSNAAEIRATVARFVGLVVSNMSLNHVGTPDPPPFARLALAGYFGFAETVFEEVREREIRPEQVVEILDRTLAAALAAARSLDAPAAS